MLSPFGSWAVSQEIPGFAPPAHAGYAFVVGELVRSLRSPPTSDATAQQPSPPDARMDVCSKRARRRTLRRPVVREVRARVAPAAERGRAAVCLPVSGHASADSSATAH